MCETEFSVVRFQGDEDKAAKVYEGMVPLSGDDVASACEWVATLPPHVNINRIEMMPEAQACGPFQVVRSSSS